MSSDGLESAMKYLQSVDEPIMNWTQGDSIAMIKFFKIYTFHAG
jgi:hypothetical protein